MYTDWWGTDIPTTKGLIQMCQTMMVTGAPTSTIIAGVKTDYDSRLPQSVQAASQTIKDLQEYLYKITPCAAGGEGMDYTQPINPRFFRAGTTRQEFH